MSALLQVGKVWESCYGTDKGRRVVVTDAPQARSYGGGFRATVKNVITGRTSYVLIGNSGLSRYKPIIHCDMCGGEPTDQFPMCCSSHGRVLCHPCYRKSHFVETPCDCHQCAPEGTRG